MFAAISQGILIGLGLALLIGPVFFSLINTSINKGTENALYLAIGISLSDVFFICLIFIGVNTLLQNEVFNYWLGIVGSGILIVFGIQNIVAKIRIKPDTHLKISAAHKVKNILKGFVLNSMHPGVILFWIATVSGILSKSTFDKTETILLFCATILTTFTCDLLKIKAASKLSYYLTVKLIKKLNIGIGVIICASGAFLLYHTLSGSPVH